MSATQPTVLVVEDEPAQREVLAYNLEAEGFRVIRAATGDEALLLVDEDMPDIIVLDWMMPGISGLELTRRLRASERLAREAAAVGRGRPVSVVPAVLGNLVNPAAVVMRLDIIDRLRGKAAPVRLRSRRHGGAHPQQLHPPPGGAGEVRKPGRTPTRRTPR